MFAARPYLSYLVAEFLYNKFIFLIVKINWIFFNAAKQIHFFCAENSGAEPIYIGKNLGANPTTDFTVIALAVCSKQHYRKEY